MKPEKSTEGSDRSLWLWVAGGFLLLVLAWTVMIGVARSADIQSVPIDSKKEAKP